MQRCFLKQEWIRHKVSWSEGLPRTWLKSKLIHTCTNHSSRNGCGACGSKVGCPSTDCKHHQAELMKSLSWSLLSSPFSFLGQCMKRISWFSGRLSLAHVPLLGPRTIYGLTGFPLDCLAPTTESSKKWDKWCQKASWVLSHKWTSLSPSLRFREHCRGGRRKNVRARERGRGQNCCGTWPDCCDFLHNKVMAGSWPKPPA